MVHPARDRWKRSYRKTVRGALDQHLISRFGEIDVGRITKEVLSSIFHIPQILSSARYGTRLASTKEHSAKAWLSLLVQGAKSLQHPAEELPTAHHLDYLVAKIKTGSLKERKKACTILARQKGISNRTIAQALHSSPRTTRSYHSVFVRHGHAQLFRSHAARNSLADEKTTRTKRVLELLHHKPQNFGINRTSWTQPSLVRVYKAQLGESISRSGVARSIRDAGFAWKKAKRVLTGTTAHMGAVALIHRVPFTDVNAVLKVV